MARLLEKERKNLITLDYADVLTQRAYLTLYAGIDSTDTGVLQRFQFDTTEMVTLGVCISNANYQNVIDVDFDIDIKAPQIVDGTGFVNVTFGQFGGDNDSEIRCRAKLAYYRGGAETIFATSEYDYIGTSNPNKDIRTLLKLTIPTTSLKIGDKLRLIIEVDAKGGSVPGNCLAMIGNDPYDNDYTYGDDGTLLKCWIPFKPVI